MEPKELCSFINSRLFIAYTRQLEISVAALFKQLPPDIFWSNYKIFTIFILIMTS